MIVQKLVSQVKAYVWVECIIQIKGFPGLGRHGDSFAGPDEFHEYRFHYLS